MGGLRATPPALMAHIVFAIPCYFGLFTDDGRAHDQDFARSLADTLEVCCAEGHQVTVLTTQRSTYIQTARNELAADFLQTDGDILFFIDDDLSWKPESAMRLIAMPDMIVAGLYRMKTASEVYCGVLHTDPDGRPLVRPGDGAMAATAVPTGFLRIRRQALEQMVTTYADRAYSIMRGDEQVQVYDLFPQGLKDGRWVGEDFAFCRLWTDILGQLWVAPDLDLTHSDRVSGQTFAGNFHQFMRRQPGGRDDPMRSADAG